MIFASVGSMLPFDRLVMAVDEWAIDHPSIPVFIQIGDGTYEPKQAKWSRMVPHSEYMERLERCRLFVAHVGMGSILQALEARKQMVLMPRHAALREHTTDHQLDTAERFESTPGLLIVNDADALKSSISSLIERPMEPSEGISPFAPQGMIDKVANFLKTGEVP